MAEAAAEEERIPPRWRQRLGDWWWANPALEREWLLRRRAEGASGRFGALKEGFHWLRLLLLLGTYAGLAHWLSLPERTPWEGRAALLGITGLYLLVLNAVLPGPAAAAIAGEQERQAWADLLLTTLRPSQLVMAKYVATLWPALRLLGLFLPAGWMALHAAHLPSGRELGLALVLLATLGAVAAYSLWLSARCRRTLVAISMAYLITGTLFWLATWHAPQLQVRGENLWWYLSPVWQVATLILFEPTASPLAAPLLPEWLWYVLGCLGVTFASLRAVVRWAAGVGA